MAWIQRNTTRMKPYRGRVAPTPTGLLHLGHAQTFGIAHQRARQADGKLVVLDSAAVDEPKTAALAKRVAALGWGSALVIDGPEVDDNFKRAVANLPGLDVLPSQGANVYDILRRDTLVVTKAGIAALEARLK